MSNLNETYQIYGAIPSEKVKSTVKQKDYVPRKGIKFPFTNSSQGYVSTSVEVELAKTNLTQLLNTTPGERVMLPSYGCDLGTLLFEPFDQQLVLEAKDRISSSISKFIPYLEIITLKVYRLDESSKYGVPSLYIKLSCQIRDNENTLFEVDVKL